MCIRDRYNAAVPNGKAQFSNVHLARERAKNAKWRAIETLDEQLENFEKVFSANGGKVIWAETGEDAIAAILAICKEKNCKTLVTVSYTHLDVYKRQACTYCQR